MIRSDELMHFGKKGMKWGVRRYQNKDGTLTDAGKRRYARDTADMSTKKKKTYNPDPDKWVREDLSRSKKVADDSANLAGKLKNVNDKQLKNQQVKKMDLSQMSDKELRDQINRALLEKQYNDMFAPRKVNRGRETAGRILETAGDVLVVTGAALGVALSVKELMQSA